MFIWLHTITVGVLSFGYQQVADVDSHNISNGYCLCSESLELTIKDVTGRTANGSYDLQIISQLSFIRHYKAALPALP